MATPADGNVMAVVKNEEFGVIKFVDIYMKRVRAGMPSFEKKNISEQNFTESK